MAAPLRQSTARTIRLGPFVDATDGVTPETGITFASADQLEVMKSGGGASVALAGTFTAVTGCDGWYDYAASTTDTNTVGDVTFVIQDSSVFLPVFARFTVLEEAVFDIMYPSGATGPAQAGDAMDLITDAIDSAALAASGLADIQAEMDAALVTIRLDEWFAAVASPTTVTAGSFFDRLTGVSTNSFDRSTDSLEAIANSITALNDLAIADVQTALTNQGYTAARAPNLDNLDVASSTLATQASVNTIDALVDTLTEAIITEQFAVQSGSTTTSILTDSGRGTNFFNNQVIVIKRAAGQSYARIVNQYNSTSGEFVIDAAPTAPILNDVVYALGVDVHSLAEIKSEVTDALADIRLDELLNAAGGAPAAGSVLEDLMGATFATATDSLEALRDRIDNRLPDALPLTAINAEVDTALTDIRLDELLNAAGGAPAAGSVLEDLMGATFTTGTDSLEAIRNQGDAAWLTAVGFAVPGSSMALTAAAVDAIWDEDIVAAHGTADTAGLLLSQLFRRSVTFNTDVVDGSILGQLADDGTAVFDRTTDSLQAIADSGGGGPTAAQIADAVWDELTAGHAVSGSFGEELTDITAAIAALNNLSAAQVNAEVDTALADIRLDEFINIAPGSNPGAGSWLDLILNPAGATPFDRNFASLTAIAEAQTMLPNAADASRLLTIAGSSTTEVRTDANETTGHWDGYVLSIHDSTNGSASRFITSYNSTNGAFTVTPALPFTPGTGHRCYVRVVSLADLSTLNDLSAAQVNTEVDTGLSDIRLDELILNAGAAPGVGSVLEDLMGATFATGTDSLEAIRNQGDSAWLTAVGFATPGAAMALTAAAVDDIWDEDIVAAHGTADTAGLLLSQLFRRGVTFNTDVVDGSILGQIADDGTAVFDRTTDSLQAIADSGGGGPTAAQIADAVWDELTAGHAVVGSFGEEVTDITAAIAALNDLSAAQVNAEVDTALSDIRLDELLLNAGGAPAAGSVFEDFMGATFATGTDSLEAIRNQGDAAWLTAVGFSTHSAADAADAVWDEDIVAAHGTADTAGLILSEITKRSVTFTTAVADGSVFGQIADDGTAVFNRTTDSLQAIADSGGGGPTAAQIADAVWDELTAGHAVSGSFGEEITDITASIAALNDLSAAAAADAVWDELTAGHAVVGSFGEEMTDLTATVAALNDISITDVQTALTNQGYTAGRAPNLDNLDVASSTLATSAALATVDANIDTILANFIMESYTVKASPTSTATTVYTTAPRGNNFFNGQVIIVRQASGSVRAAGVVDTYTQTNGQFNFSKSLGFVPVEDDIVNVTSLQITTAVEDGLTAQGYTTGRAALLDNLDAAITSLNDLSIADVQTALTNQGYTGARAILIDNLDAAISSLNDLAVVDVQTALTNQGYTAARAPNLDNLDATILSRAAPGAAMDLIANALDATSLATSAVDEIADQVWEELIADHSGTSGSTAEALAAVGLSAQDIRDAMKLAPTAGAPAAGSVDLHLDDILTNIAALNDISIADVQTGLTNQGYTAGRAVLLDNLDAAITSLNDLSIADVQAALTNQGYTAARGILLDNLDAAITSRSSHTPANVDTTLTAAHGSGGWTTAVLGGLNDLSIADVQTALTNQGYTAGRAPNLDNLDLAISALNDLDSAEVQAAAAAAVLADARLILLEKLLRNRFETNATTGVATLYDDDGTSVLLTADIFEDSAGAQPYRALGLERRDRFTP